MKGLVFLSIVTIAASQQVGTYSPERHPPLTWQSCTIKNGCTTKNGNLTLDEQWRWVHNATGYTNCYTDDSWDPKLCPDNRSCAKNCAVEGADSYSSNGGITTSGDSVSMKYLRPIADCCLLVGSRVFMMEDDNHYQVFKLLNQEVSFEVDTSSLVCGTNGALYFVGMDADGGSSRYPANKAGAKYGTGYCDAQCPRYVRFINGENWTSFLPPYGSQGNEASTGYGSHGSCCSELDIWNANSAATQFSAKPCKTASQTRCDGDSCGGGDSSSRYGDFCDPDGCDFNPYRMGDKTFYGAGAVLDSTKPLTVVTQFITDDGTADGDLSEIKRFYVQNGLRIENPASKISSISGNSLTPSYCTNQKAVFGDRDEFGKQGGFAAMTEALKKGMVLTLMVWDDKYQDMTWLDSALPRDADPSKPGVLRGACPFDDTSLENIANDAWRSTVTFKGIRVGDIGSTV